MSGHGFHVHGPHDHEVEHAAHGGDGFSNKIAMMTAIMATVGAFFGYLAGATQNEAAMRKNDAAIKKTAAANQWSLYQSKSNKQNLAELAIELPNVNAEKYRSEAARYKTEKEEIKLVATKLEEESSEFEKESDSAMHQHHRWAQAMTAVQVAISLAAIALLTKKRWLEYASYTIATAGVVVGVLAWLHI
jgi:hypothetical protein